jgi:hypothetical protein
MLRNFGTEAGEDPAAAIDELSAIEEKVADLKRSSDLAQRQLDEWLAKNRRALEDLARRKAENTTHGASQYVELFLQQRDKFLHDQAQAEEQRSALLESLEKSLAVRQEIELLSKRRQQATSNLFTIQKTAEYLTKAREGLDGRYLGDLGDRFVDYASAWLADDEVDAVVNADFGVELYEDGHKHDVAGYSTGYQDLLDVCLRMALIDTIFQAEEPFIILDDPFANLDEEKIGRALPLLKTLAERYQVIYFTCHPSRMELAPSVAGRASFVLPEQRARRELPRARAKREAEERAKAQAELVASYVVVPTGSGKASIQPAGDRRTISNNLFTLEFEVDDSMGARDNSFEVHFIDEKGRALCDRQTVQVIEGQVVPDKVRFSLTTREDSGSTYDLIVHEDGREPHELAARVPYRAEVAFASMDFDF